RCSSVPYEYEIHGGKRPHSYQESFSAGHRYPARPPDCRLPPGWHTAASACRGAAASFRSHRAKARCGALRAPDRPAVLRQKNPPCPALSKSEGFLRWTALTFILQCRLFKMREFLGQKVVSLRLLCPCLLLTNIVEA